MPAVPVRLFGEGTVREAVEAYKAGQLPVVGEASGPAHAGMGGGRGLGLGMGRRAAVSSLAVGSPPVVAGSREEEIAELKDMAGALHKQLAEVLERLDRLEKGS